MAHCIFDLSNVVKTRKTTDRYHLNISRFQVQQGDTLAIVGRSGCGKSTALDLLACALRPDPPHEKSAFFFSPSPDRKIDLYAAWDRDGINATAEERMRHLGYILQTGGLLPFLTARDNILLVSKILNIMPARITAIREITEELNISPLLSKYPAQLSVGERQRVAIAKALAHNPTAVLADEPTAALDPNHSKLVMKLFLGLARRQGSTIIMVSHDQALAAELGFTLVPMNVTASSEGVSASLYFASNMGSS